MFKAHNVVLVKATMNLNFRHKLLLGARLCEGTFCNNLAGRHSLSLKISEFIALSETTFTEKFTSHIFLNLNVAVKLDYLLFDYYLRIIDLILL